MVRMAAAAALALGVGFLALACADDPPAGSSGLPGDVPRVVTDAAAEAAVPEAGDGSADAKPLDAPKE